MIVLQADRLRELGTAIFMALGAPKAKAEFVAETLVEASLTGHDSHGVSYFVRYADRIRRGYIDVDAEPAVVKESAATALLDGRWGFGQVTAMRVMELAVEKANLVSAVGAFNCNHIGRVGYYTAWAARQGVVGMMFVNVGHPAVAVHGGVGRVFGTNPFSSSAPTSETEPYLLDYATSVVAEGKVTLARAKHEKIPLHWIRDKEGKATDDPYDMKDGGWLLPFGGHKGYCLQLLMELMGAVMTGSRTGLSPETEPPSPNGVFAIAVDPEGFVGLETFRQRSERLFRGVKATTPEAGGRILIPGEPEWESRRRRMRDGIPVPEETWDQMAKLAEEIGLDPQDYVDG
ncbi:MAG: Ldh family oxidoreductase [Candidatus Bathyarchaeia archaeon]